MRWIFVIAGVVCSVIAIIIGIFAITDIPQLMHLKEEINELDRKINQSNLFESTQEPQGQVLTVKQQYEQCINRQQYNKLMGSVSEEKC
jgi:DnaJ-domain-containing protein 1